MNTLSAATSATVQYNMRRLTNNEEKYISRDCKIASLQTSQAKHDAGNTANLFIGERTILFPNNIMYLSTLYYTERKMILSLLHPIG